MLEKLGPWSTGAATGYQSEYLACFDSPWYDIDIDADAGFASAKQDMASAVDRDVHRRRQDFSRLRERQHRRGHR